MSGFDGLIGRGIGGSQDITGNAATVTVADESTDTTCFPAFFTAATGNLPAKTGSNLTFNAADGILGATIFDGPIGTGGATPAAGSFTTLSASSTLDVTGVSTLRSLVNIDPNDDGQDALRILDESGAKFIAFTPEISADKARLGYWTGAAFGALDIGASTATFSGILSTTDATDATSATAASMKTAGGIATVKALWIGTTSRLVGAVTMDSSLNVAGITTLTAGVGIGAAGVATVGLRQQSTISGSNPLGYEDRATLTVTSGSLSAKLLLANSGGITLNTGSAVAIAATAVLYEPVLTVSTGSVALAATLYIGNAPTEGTAYNNAIHVASGSTYLGGTLEWGGGVSIADSGKVNPDYAGIGQHDNANATVIYAKEIPTLIDDWDDDMPEVVSNGDFANNRVVVGASIPYRISIMSGGESAAVNKEFEVEVYRVAVATQAITDITDADPAVVTIAGHGLSGGEYVYTTDVVGMVEVNQQIFKVVYIGVDTFSLDALDDTDVDATGYTAYDSAGTIQEVNTSAVLSACQEYVSANKKYNVFDSAIETLTLGEYLMPFVKGETDATNFLCVYAHLTLDRV